MAFLWQDKYYHNLDQNQSLCLVVYQQIVLNQTVYLCLPFHAFQEKSYTLF